MTENVLKEKLFDVCSTQSNVIRFNDRTARFRHSFPSGSSYANGGGCKSAETGMDLRCRTRAGFPALVSRGTFFFLERNSYFSYAVFVSAAWGRR